MVPLTWGVDTLVLTYRAPVPHATISLLGAAKALARASMERGSSEPATARLADREWIVRAQSKPPYRFMLHRPEEMDVRVAGVSSLPGSTPTIVIELRSAYLWQRGYAQAAADAQELARALLEAPDRCLEACARLDLCADFQGWVPTGLDDERRRLVRRVRKSIDMHGDGRYFTGYSIGLRLPLQARLYDKTAEIAGSDKMWFHDLWIAAGYDPARPVWRLEVQALTESLDEMGLRYSWRENIAKRLDELWRFAFGHPDWRPEVEGDAAREIRRYRDEARRRKKGGVSDADPSMLALLEREAHDEARDHGAWLSLRDPASGERATWPIAPEWRALQRVVFVEREARRGFRLVQREVKLENQVRQWRALTASIGANAGVRPRVGIGSELVRTVRVLRDCYEQAEQRVLRIELEEPEKRGIVQRLEEKSCALQPLHDPEPRSQLPNAPWEPAPDRVKTIPWSPDDRLYGPAQLNVRSTRSLWRPALDLFGEGPDEERKRRQRARSLRFDRTEKWTTGGAA